MVVVRRGVVHRGPRGRFCATASAAAFSSASMTFEFAYRRPASICAYQRRPPALAPTAPVSRRPVGAGVNARCLGRLRQRRSHGHGGRPAWRSRPGLGATASRLLRMRCASFFAFSPSAAVLSHIPDDGLATLIHVHMLDPHKLGAALAQTPERLDFQAKPGQAKRDAPTLRRRQVRHRRWHPRRPRFEGLASRQRGLGRQFSPSRAASFYRTQAP
jgi:hypothetical protein